MPTTWRRRSVRPTAPFPEVPLVVYGPGEESGTYDTFVEFAIADLAEERGAEEATRADYTSSANDNLIVQGIESADTSLGWVGYAYFVAEQERMKSIAVDNGDGCVEPTAETIGDGSYPFSRSLYIYVNSGKAAENPAVASFVDLYLSEQGLATVGDGRLRRPAGRSDPGEPGRLGRHVRTRPNSVGRPQSPRAGRRSRVHASRSKRITEQHRHRRLREGFPPRAHR